MGWIITINTTKPGGEHISHQDVNECFIGSQKELVSLNVIRLAN